jgi:hypothetical protein
MRRLVIGFVLILATVLGMIWLSGGSPLWFVGIPAFLIVFFVPVFSVLSIWSRKSWARAFAHAVKADGTTEERMTSGRVWSLYEGSAYISGLLGSIATMTIMLVHLDQARWSQQLATCFTPLVYGTLLGLASRIMKARVEYLGPRQK